MNTGKFTDYARITSDGQVTIPKDVREALGVSNGDRITFVVDGNIMLCRNFKKKWQARLNVQAGSQMTM